MSGVLTCVQNAVGWTYLDTIARVQGLTYEWDYPGGPTSAELSLDAPAGLAIPALSIGSTMLLRRGTGIVWQGKVSSVDRDGWRIQADGLAGLATREPAPITGTLDAIVDAAITGGLPWTRPATLGAYSWDGGEGASELGQTMLDEVLASTLLANGKVWRLDVNGALSAEPQPSTPAYIVRADTAPPLALNDYATHVTARYRTSSTYGSGTRFATVTVSNATAATKFGRVNRSIDLSKMGVITATTAQTYAQNYLNTVSPRMTTTGDLTVQPGHLTTAAGAPVDLAGMRPGVVARIQLVSLVRDALVAPTTSVDVLIGATKYDADADQLTLSPAERAADPLQIMFGGRAVRSDAA